MRKATIFQSLNKFPVKPKHRKMSEKIGGGKNLAANFPVRNILKIRLFEHQTNPIALSVSFEWMRAVL